MDSTRPSVVVVGGGFGGLSAVKALKRAPVDVTLVDRENYHLFQPFLYQIGTAELPAADVAAPPGRRVRRCAGRSGARGPREQLEQLGVVIHMGKRATDIDPNGVTLDDGTRLEAATVIWTAGVKPTSLAAALPGEHARGRVVVAPDLSLPGHPEVFVIGDMAHVVQQDGAPVPGVSPAAIQQGRAAAVAIVCSLEKRDRKP
jgi:NADH dehydrogenase FAD-containing subunit